MLNTPVLLIAFNRPIQTKKVFEQIRKTKPQKFYIAIDGPRSNKPEDVIKIKKVYEIFKNIDWKCSTFFLKRKNNLGCKTSVSSAIDWFFKFEQQGIILEDDCLPCSDFFFFCQELLLKYEYNRNIHMISGVNFQDGNIRGDGSYYFSKLTHVWGWATWKRAWKHYDVNMSYWPSFKKSEEFKKIFNLRKPTKYFRSIFDSTFNSKIDTWDYQWTACVWYNKGLSIIPNNNLVINIGFDADATHTFEKPKKLNDQKTKNILPIIHPSAIKQNFQADEYTFDNYLAGPEISFFKKIIEKIKYFFFNNKI